MDDHRRGRPPAFLSAARRAAAYARHAAADHWAHPRRLALESYAFFVVALVFLVPFFPAIAVAAALLNAVVTLTLAGAMAAAETVAGRAWTLRYRRLSAADRRVAGTVDRTLQYASFVWLYGGAALIVVAVYVRI